LTQAQQLTLLALEPVLATPLLRAKTQAMQALAVQALAVLPAAMRRPQQQRVPH
jgi:hypothetical protein